MAVTPRRLIPGSQLGDSIGTFYTATNVTARVDACALTNTTAGAVTVTMHLVPSGGAADATNCILSAHSIAAGTTYIVPGAIGQWLQSGGTIQAMADTAASVTLVASGVEYT